MKTKELIKYFEGEGYKALFDAYCDRGVLFMNKNHETLLCILKGDRIVTDYCTFNDLDSSKKQEYYKVIFEYLMTPIKKRKEEKKYYLRQIGINEYDNFLNLEYETQSYYVSSNEEFYDYKTKFTQSEIDEMPECYTHPAVWEKIEVESGE